MPQQVGADLLILDAGELLTCPYRAVNARPGLGRIPGGAIAAEQGQIVWVGETDRWTDAVRLHAGAEIVEAEGKVVMPGLVECHTHLVFAGNRAEELQVRVSGASYPDITSAGGGIMSTVHATRKTSSEKLGDIARRRLDRFLRYGVTTLEAKSGYGLTVDEELRMLEVCRKAAEGHPLDVVSTLLAAHAIPVEFFGRADAYVDLIVDKLIPAVAKRRLARFCDAFCVEEAFSVAQCRRVLLAGKAHGMRPKLHADLLSYRGGAELAVEVGAVSADHLNMVSQEGIAALAAASAPGPRGGRGPVAVLLPGTAFFLNVEERAPSRQLLDAGVRVALSTDFNPGSSPTQNLWLMTTMGCCHFGMTDTEVIRAVTIEAAAALGLEEEVGSLELGKKADILILENSRHNEIPYRYGMNPVWRVYKQGKCVVKREPAGEAW